MGTRHLIAVYDRNGELRVAQYGQWDGYPTGQGFAVLKALPKLRSEHFEGLTFAPETNEFSPQEHPQFHRDTSAKVLEMVIENPGMVLANCISFAEDSLFCEWAYVIDFKENVFEIFRGFNRVEAEGRFAKKLDGEYQPVTLMRSWSLDALPSEADLKALQEEAYPE